MSLRSLTLLLGVSLLATAARAAERPGLLLRVFELGESVNALPELVPGEKPNEVRVVRVPDLRTERNDFAPHRQNFVSELLGTVTVAQEGEYTLRLISDDGSRLWLDGRVLIDHDGLHRAEPKDAAVHLSRGPHALRVVHFQAGGDGQITLQWRRPGAAPEAFEVVPVDVLSHPAELPRDTAPGRKRFIPALRRGLPGDGRPVAAMHPGFRLEPGTLGVQDELQALELMSRIREIGAGFGADPRPPLAWLPPETFAAGGLGPLPGYDGQYVIGAATGGESKRIAIERIGEQEQGVVFRFAPPGDGLLRPTGQPVFELKTVRALANGLELEFTQPLDPRVEWDPESYYVEQWPFDPATRQPPQRDGTRAAVKSASVSDDRRSVFLEILDLQTPRVVYLRLLPPCLSADGQKPWITEAWYTLYALPVDRRGIVRPRPAEPPQNVLTPEEQAAGWRLLFDGSTPRGWVGYGRATFPEGWQVMDGCLTRVGPGGDIMTDAEFDDFELELEWRIGAGGNSGIFYRVDPRQGAAWETGPEMQVLDNAEHPDGREPRTSAGACYDLYAPARDVTQPVGLFNRARIVVRGPQVEHWLNGEKIVEYELGSPAREERVRNSKFAQRPGYGRAPRGRIVLQDHGDRVWYRNIRIRPLAGGPQP